MASYPSLEASLAAFHGDFAFSLQLSSAFDTKVKADAIAAVNEKYASLCALAARQVFSGMEITVAKSQDGSYNTSDVMIFMKEIATGECCRESVYSVTLD